MASFGGIDCDFVKGVPQPILERVAIWTTPGIDGQGYHRLGRRGAEYSVKLVKFGTEAAVSVWIKSIEARMATTVIYVDDHAETSPLCFVVNVGRPVKSVAIGEGGKRAEIDVQVQAVSG